MLSVIHIPLEDYETRIENGRTIHVCTMRQILTHTIGMDSKGTYTR